VALERRGIEHRSRDDAIAKAGREPLDLSLDAREHVRRGREWHVAITPGDVTSSRRARRIEERRLREEDKRPIGDPSVPCVALGARNLVERATDVHRRRPGAVRSAPRNRAVERPVDFERRHSVAIRLQLPSIPRRKSMPRNLQQRSG